MKKLEELKLQSPPSWQTERLARWLHEWQLSQTIPQGDTTPPEDAQSKDDSMPASPTLAEQSNDTPLTPGQIRLLKPHPEAPDDGPVFVATLKADSENSVTCIPFSRFSEPATPNELLTKRAQTVVRVLCLWNARIVPLSHAEAGWLVDHLTDQEIAHFTHAFNTVRQTGGLPASQQTLGGPPLVHPDDPRRIYLRKERMRISLYLPESKHAEAPSMLRYPESGTRLPDELPLAAEDSEDYTSE